MPLMVLSMRETNSLVAERFYVRPEFYVSTFACIPDTNCGHLHPSVVSRFFYIERRTRSAVPYAAPRLPNTDIHIWEWESSAMN
jgi:hypothetical protein